MRLKNIWGAEVSKSFLKYKIKWDKVVGSKLQFKVKQALREFWEGDDVYEELLIPNSKLRVDLVNFTTKTVVEVSPKSSHEYNEFFDKNRRNFLEARKRDMQKVDWCDFNDLRYVELGDAEIKDDGLIVDKVVI